MATYKKNDALTYLLVGNNRSTKSGMDTYQATRCYLRFDTSTITPSVSNITAVDLTMNMESYSFNTDTVRAKSAKSTDTNWGTALTADGTDFSSTNAHNEGTADCSSTGTKTFSIDKNNLDYSGTTWFRLSLENYEYNYYYNVVIRFSSQDHATQANRPKLVITYTVAGATYTQVLICTT